MCKTINEVAITIKNLKLTIEILEKEIECLKRVQYGGCKLRTKQCENRFDSLKVGDNE